MHLVVLLHVERLVSEGNHVQITTCGKHLAYSNTFVMKQKLHNDKQVPTVTCFRSSSRFFHVGTRTVQNMPIYKCRESVLRIRIKLKGRIPIRIRIRVISWMDNVWNMSLFEQILTLFRGQDSDPDPHQSERQDPDPNLHLSDKQDPDPDPHQGDADPLNCRQVFQKNHAQGKCCTILQFTRSQPQAHNIRLVIEI